MSIINKLIVSTIKKLTNDTKLFSSNRIENGSEKKNKYNKGLTISEKSRIEISVGFIKELNITVNK